MNICGKGGPYNADLSIQCYYHSFPFMTTTNAPSAGIHNRAGGAETTMNIRAVNICNQQHAQDPDIPVIFNCHNRLKGN